MVTSGINSKLGKSKMSLKKNDQVQIITGKEKGKIGKIISVDLKCDRVTVEKLNMVKRHMKRTQQNPNGGITQKESSIHCSNVLLFCPKCNRGVRQGRKIVEKVEKGITKQVKVRTCKNCSESLDLM